MFTRAKLATLVAEFLGTATLVLVVLAIMRSNMGFAFFIASGGGLAYGLLTLVFGATSGAHFNPALTLGLWSTRKVSTLKAIVFVAVQLLGALVASELYVYLSGIAVKDVPVASVEWPVVTAEALGAFVLTFGVAAAIYQNYKGLRYAATAGGALFLAVLIAGLATTGEINYIGWANPAIALGAGTWSLAYVAGPLLGAVIGGNLYAWLFTPQEVRALKRAAKKAAIAEAKAEAAASKQAQAIKAKATKPAAKKTKKTTVKKKTSKK